MATAVCPTSAEWEKLLLGRLPSDRAAALHRHLDECPDCPARVHELKLESRLMKVLVEHPTVADDGPSPGLNLLMDHLERLVSDTGPIPDEHESASEFPFLNPAEADDELGRLANYRVLEVLGRGGMGFVFRAEDTRLARSVAFKVLRPHVARNPASRERFLREARAMASLHHDHIAVVHDVGSEVGPNGEETPYLAMERLEGETLLDWLRANPRPPIEQVVRIGREAAAGLAAAHATGLVHRDVKPSNLWLEAPTGWRYDPPLERPSLGAVGRVKIIDFGMAAPANPRADGDGLSGTIGYMAPEQLRGEPQDARCDLFALGCVLYELATGEHPFPGRIVPRAFAGDPTPAPLRDLRPDAPPEFAKLVWRMLEEFPENRPASAREVERTLAALQEAKRKPGSGRRWLLPAAVSAVAVVVLAAVALRERIPAVADVPAPPATHDVEPPGRPPFPDGPPDEWWCRRTAELPSQEQYRTVTTKLVELNPGMSEDQVAGWIEKEAVLRYTVKSDSIRDVRPVRGFRDVKSIGIEGDVLRGRGSFTDVSPLAGLRLYRLSLMNNRELTDLSPLKGDALTVLILSNTGVTSLDAVNGRLLEELRIADTAIHDLTPLRSMPRLHTFDCAGCIIDSFEPLEATSIRNLRGTFKPERDYPVLRKLTRLTQINGMPAREFWKSTEAKAK